jgi:hypothetical protein
MSRGARHGAWLASALGAFTLTLLLVPSVFAGPDASEQRSSVKTAGKLTYYRDSRNYGTANIMTSASGLPLGLQFWGFTDIHGNQGGEGAEFARFFMEYRLSRPLPKKFVGIKGLGVQAEYNDFNGAGNSVSRFGVTFRHRTYGDRGWLQWRYFPVETDGDGGQASVIYLLSPHETSLDRRIRRLELELGPKGPLGARAAVDLQALQAAGGRA